MNARRSLLRGAASLALAAAIIGTGALAPVAAASPLDNGTVSETVNKPGKPNFGGVPSIPGLGDIPGAGQIPGLGDLPGAGQIPGVGEIPGLNNIGSGGTDIGDIPIIGDVANTFKDAEPEEIVTGTIQLAGAAAEIIVPMIVEATK